jgi:pimeloyl-ACP methyl ester carboxylesterase
MTASPETRYARNGTVHLAYQVLGSGPPNLLVVQSGPNSHVDYMWTEPSLARFLRRLASFTRLIMYDNRGVGLSDPVPGPAVASPAGAARAYPEGIKPREASPARDSDGRGILPRRPVTLRVL